MLLDFAHAHLRLAPVALVPEIQLYQAEEPIGLWELTEGEYRSDRPPPFWAFAWAGGQALARYVVDHPEAVAGRRVLDLAAGSGLVAIAAARAGAASVRAVDIDPLALEAVRLNATANDVVVETVCADILGGDPVEADLITAGDVCYSRAMTDRVLGYLRRCARTGARVIVGDPGRAFFPATGFTALSRVEVPVSYALESTRVKATVVWELTPPRPASPTRS